MLFRSIASGEFQGSEDGEGGKIPTETQLGAYYQVSTAVVRQAVDELVAMGKVERVQGRGTYVISRAPVLLNLTRTEELTHRREQLHFAADSWATDMRQAGRTPSWRFELLKVRADANIAAILDVEPGMVLTQRCSYRSLDGRPSTVEKSYFPTWLVRQLPRLDEPDDIPEGTTYYLAEHGFPLLDHVLELESTPVTEEDNEFLRQPSNVWVVRTRKITYESPEQGSRALRVMDTVYRADEYKFQMHIPGKGVVQRLTGR